MAERHQQHGEAIRKFKGTTVFDWDSEPSEERPSEFAESSLYLSQTAIARPSGYSSRGSGYANSTLERPRARPAQKKGGSSTLWLALAMVLVITAGGLYGLMRWLHA